MDRARKRYVAAIVLVASGAIFLLVLIPATRYSSELELPATTALATSTRLGSAYYPVRIAIPTIGVGAHIQQRGLVAGNRMAAPTNYTDVAWYKYGAVPGEVGAAVLYAHLDNGLGLNGVFKNLDKLSIGDEIDITTASGTPERFIVSKVASYPYKEVPAEALGQGLVDGNAYITLITCAGNPLRDPVEGYTYDHRLVVYAKLK